MGKPSSEADKRADVLQARCKELEEKLECADARAVAAEAAAEQSKVKLNKNTRKMLERVCVCVCLHRIVARGHMCFVAAGRMNAASQH